MSRDVAREVARERAAGAQHRRLVREAKEARRASRRAKREVTGRWWRRAGVAVDDQSRLAAAPAARPEDVTRALTVLLDGVAERIAEAGTESERFALHVVSDVTRWLAPGAAEALVDWEGTEAARLRAYGVLHGVVLRGLDGADHVWLLDRLRGTGATEHEERVA